VPCRCADVPRATYCPFLLLPLFCSLYPGTRRLFCTLDVQTVLSARSLLSSPSSILMTFVRSPCFTYTRYRLLRWRHTFFAFTTVVTSALPTALPVYFSHFCRPLPWRSLFNVCCCCALRLTYFRHFRDDHAIYAYAMPNTPTHYLPYLLVATCCDARAVDYQHCTSLTEIMPWCYSCSPLFCRMASVSPAYLVEHVYPCQISAPLARHCLPVFVSLFTNPANCYVPAPLILPFPWTRDCRRCTARAYHIPSPYLVLLPWIDFRLGRLTYLLAAPSGFPGLPPLPHLSPSTAFSPPHRLPIAAQFVVAFGCSSYSPLCLPTLLPAAHPAILACIPCDVDNVSFLLVGLL